MVLEESKLNASEQRRRNDAARCIDQQILNDQRDGLDLIGV